MWFTQSVDAWPMDNELVRRKTAEDADLTEVMGFVRTDKWPSKVRTEIAPYWHKRAELHIDQGVLMWGAPGSDTQNAENEIAGGNTHGAFGHSKNQDVS
ncbi:hypothetical protein NQ315_002069 [Exocentrus adspersus]|uniref:Uncharacterized protein n=1 Tax=Exocentrus adspersus TaxID=1586481 RepID=A0AAV8V4T8_9CUCU|nr:hypothetical protein NQ315_002069 [Exocentrus adspersus]